MKKLFTSESVTEGHPDKVCDFIADSILDAALEGDRESRVACEVCASSGLVVILGEFTTESYVDTQKVTRTAIESIGYTDPSLGFDAKTCAVLNCINEQSPDISQGVTTSLEKRDGATDVSDSCGAGDQGMMYGYACDDTDTFMPLPIAYAHALTKRLTDVRKSKELDFLRPDGKAQVSALYEDGVVKSIKTVVVSAQHSPQVGQKELKEAIVESVIKKAIPSSLLKGAEYIVNPTGRFVVGGPAGDTGVTGRKIIVDTYGGAIPHGGGAMSGKDPSKVDRSASYYCRYVAKNIVAAGLCKRVSVSVAYAIGKARPVAINVDSFGALDDDKLLRAVESVFDFRPYSIIESLDLKRPIYKHTTNYGHFGRPDLPWEKTDKKQEIADAYKA